MKPLRKKVKKTIMPTFAPPLRLDLGCGPHKREGFLGVDVSAFDGVDVIADLRETRWRFSATTDVRLVPVSARTVASGDVKLDGGAKASAAMVSFADDSVEEAHASHFVEHLTAPERIHFVNELYRVLKPGGKCLIIVPHWASGRAYGDLTHQWPPVSGFWFQYLLKEWRAVNAPHNDLYTCDFDATWGFALHPQIAPRNQEYQMHALTFFIEAAQDIIATLTKR